MLFRAPERVISLGDQKKVWAYDPRTKTWHTYKAPKGVNVDTQTSTSGRFIALRVSGEPIAEVAVFSTKTGKWNRQALVEPARTREVYPLLGNNYVAYLIGRHAYAFSNVTGKWCPHALNPAGKEPYIHIQFVNFIMYWDNRSIHAFSALTGTWETMEIEKGTSPQTLQGPSDTALVFNGSRLYSFDPKKAHFEKVKADED